MLADRGENKAASEAITTMKFLSRGLKMEYGGSGGCCPSCPRLGRSGSVWLSGSPLSKFSKVGSCFSSCAEVASDFLISAFLALSASVELRDSISCIDPAALIALA